jgi:predicted DNA-binding transcriptional regulator AlpA
MSRSCAYRATTGTANQARLDDRLLTGPEVREYLGISASTFRRERLAGIIPPPDLQLKRQGRWRKSSLDAALARSRKGVR